MKKRGPANQRPPNQRPPNQMAQGLNVMKPHAAEERLRAIAAQEQRPALAHQAERRAQASRTPTQVPAHVGLVPPALVPTETGREIQGVQNNPRDSKSAFRETADCASVPVTDCASVQAPPGVVAFTQDQRMYAFTQDQRQSSQALDENCQALLAWYDEYAEETEQRQQQIAEDFAGWRQSRGGVLHWQASAPARPLPLRAGKRTQLGRAHQHWDTPEGRLLVQVRLCEAVLLPKMRAQNAGERDAVNAQIAAGLGLAAAAKAGVLTGFLVGWQATGRWPRRPVSVQLFWPGGSRQGGRLRGKYGPLLTHLQEKARVHFNAERSK